MDSTGNSHKVKHNYVLGLCEEVVGEYFTDNTALCNVDAPTATYSTNQYLVFVIVAEVVYKLCWLKCDRSQM